MPDEKEHKQDRYDLMSGDKVLFTGTYEACKAEWQRRHEQERKTFHERKFQRQLRWQERGAKDDDRERCYIDTAGNSLGGN